MNTSYEIIDEKKFNENIEQLDVYLTSHENTRTGFHATGDVHIVLKNGKNKHASGEFGKNDYKEIYGFIFVCNDND